MGILVIVCAGVEETEKVTVTVTVTVTVRAVVMVGE